MNRHSNSIQKGLFLITIASATVLGCELIVDFDRTRIPVEQTEAGPVDSSVVDTGTDTGVDASLTDAADAADAEDAADAPDGD